MTPHGHALPALPARWFSPARVYWLLQIGGWGGVAATHLFMLDTVGRLTASMASGFLVASILALLGTDAIRRFLHRRRWIDLSLPRIGGRVLGCCVAIAASIYTGAVLMERFVLIEANPIRLTAASAIRIVVYWTVLLIGWSCGYLGLHFYRKARLADRDRWKLEATVRETELEVLKSQLDPHFMFNSLNSIRALVAEDPESARVMITQLASILRYSLQASRATTVLLEEEMRIVRSYLALESIRLEERLRHRLEVEDAVRRALIPPMMVQVLVENGIKHGIADRVDGGEIRVVARAHERMLVIQTFNTGELKTENDAGGIGLRNARDRLRLLYGERGTLTLKEDPPGTVVAELNLPLERSHESPDRRR